VILLTFDDDLHIGERVLGEVQVQVRDAGLLESAVSLPATTVFGEDAYRTIHHKAAALLQWVVNNHPLVDGNKRLGFVSVLAFYGANGFQLALTNDAAYDLVIAVATGELAEISDIAPRMEQSVEPWSRTP
jgi:death-on-curing protein